MAMGTLYSKKYIYIYIYVMLYSAFHMLGVIYLGCVNLCLNLYSGIEAIFLNLLLFPVRL